MRIVTKIDVFLLSLLLLASFLAHLDKNSLAYAAVLGMSDDLELHGQQYPWLGSIFYVGYLITEFPTAWILTKVPIGKYLSTTMVLWGVCLGSMAACTNFASAAAVRFLLGILEAGLIPSCIIFTANWYRREEQPLRHALWFAPFSGIFGGILAYSVGGLHSQIPVWKVLFLTYGASTVCLGLVCFFGLPDDHANAWFLSDEEREEAKRRISGNKTGSDLRKRWQLAQITESLTDGKYWVILVFGVFQSITNAGITNFNPLILSAFGYSKRVTVLLAAPQGAVALVAQVAASIAALYMQNTRCLLWIASCIPAAAGVLIVRYVDPASHKIAGLMGLYLTGFYNVSWIMAMSLVSSNTAGATKKSFASVSMAISYAVGNMIGPQFFRDDQKPLYPLGVGAMIVAFIAMGICGILYRTICIHQNRVRDKAYREVSPLLPMPPTETNSGSSGSGNANLLGDETDFEILTFRYTY